MTISRILVPIDFSESSLEALTTACDLSRRFGAQLDLLNVVEPLPPTADLMLFNPYEQISRQAKDALADLPSPDQSALPVRRVVRLGYAAETITSYARNEGVDLIVFGTHGRTGLSHLVLGSVAEKVVRTAPCPVFVARAVPQAAAA